jgi:hypothetical protein
MPYFAGILHPKVQAKAGGREKTPSPYVKKEKK